MASPDRAWRLAGGRLEAVALPEHPELWHVPEPVRARAADTGELVPVCLLGGREAPDFEAFTLPLVAELATRLTPWATWYWSPAWFGAADWGGQAWGAQEVALCRSTYSPPHAVATVLHEAWHLAEALLAPDLLADLDDRLGQGPAWPGDYHPRPCERRARAFESWGMALVEGVRHVVGGPGAPPEVALFWAVFSGEFGREVQASRAPRRPSLARRALARLTARAA